MRNFVVLIVLLLAVSTEAFAGVAWTETDSMNSVCETEGVDNMEVIPLNGDQPIILRGCDGVSFDSCSSQDDGLCTFALLDEQDVEFRVHVEKLISLPREGEEQIRRRFILRPV